MNKQEFLEQLKGRLSGLPAADVDERLESPFRWQHLKRAGKYIARLQQL